MKQMKRLKLVLMMAALTCMAMVSSALAFTAPDSTSIMYQVYDIIIVKMINGGVTYIVGFIGLCAAAYFLMQQKLTPALFIIIGSILFLSANSMATAFGLTLF